MGQQDFTQWQASYGVGNWLLNNQHKVLLGLCSQIIECVAEDGEGFVGRFSLIRDDLLDSVEEHFRTEENLLRNCAYPLLLEHVQEHRESRLRLGKFLISMTSSAPVDKEAINDFLSRWWCHHVLDSDRKFVGAIHRTHPEEL